jgi:hypothetical protein
MDWSKRSSQGRTKLISGGLDAILKVIFFLVTSVALYLVINDRQVLKFIPVNTKGLRPIGFARNPKGDVLRKLAHDTLYLPLFSKQRIYQNDMIISGENSSTEIQIDKYNSITTEPNSAIRLNIDQSGINILFQKGSVVTNFSKERVLNLQQGLMNKQITIRKGTYLVKNSSVGLQITAYSSSHKIKKSTQEKGAQTKAKLAQSAQVETTSENSAEDNGEANSEPNENGEESVLKRKENQIVAEKAFQAEMALRKLASPIEFPHPSDGTSFLLNGPYQLTLAAKDFCFGKCHLRVSKGSELILEQDFRNLEVGSQTIELDEKSYGHYTWIFSDSEGQSSFHFDVNYFSEENFAKALEMAVPIEVH